MRRPTPRRAECLSIQSSEKAKHLLMVHYKSRTTTNDVFLKVDIRLARGWLFLTLSPTASRRTRFVASSTSGEAIRTGKARLGARRDPETDVSSTHPIALTNDTLHDFSVKPSTTSDVRAVSLRWCTHDLQKWVCLIAALAALQQDSTT